MHFDQPSSLTDSCLVEVGVVSVCMSHERLFVLLALMQ